MPRGLDSVTMRAAESLISAALIETVREQVEALFPEGTRYETKSAEFLRDHTTVLVAVQVPVRAGDIRITIQKETS